MSLRNGRKRSTKRNSPHTRYPKRHIIHTPTHIYSKHEFKLTGKKKKRLSNDRNIFTTILRCKRNIYEKHTELFILHAYTNENYIQYIWKYTIYNPQQMGICHSSLALYGIFKQHTHHHTASYHLHRTQNTLSRTHFQAYKLS